MYLEEVENEHEQWKNEHSPWLLLILKKIHLKLIQIPFSTKHKLAKSAFLLFNTLTVQFKTNFIHYRFNPLVIINSPAVCTYNAISEFYDLFFL